VSGDITQQQIRETVIEVLGRIPDVGQKTPPEILFESAAGKKYKVRVRFWGNVYRTEQVVSETRMALYESFAKREVVMED
jgi:small-conductance mechanosensitive channel